MTEVLVASGKYNEDHPERKLRVLMVDDEPAIRGLFEAVAARTPDIIGVFDTAESGEEALRMLASDTGYQVVITDLRMPGMSGEQLAKAISEKTPDIGVYAISGTLGVDISDPKEHGFKGALAKPANVEQIRGFLTQIHGDVFHPQVK
jgi:YesN/AraC family two-component response regulator